MDIEQDIGKLVSISRGNRNYIHSLDIINAAPVNADDFTFCFRFRALATSPGLWVDGSTAQVEQKRLAELRTTGQDGERRYVFICLDEGISLDKFPQFDFEYDPVKLQFSDNQILGPLHKKYPFFLQLTELIKVARFNLTSKNNWVTASISGTPASMQTVPERASIILQVVEQRHRYLLFEYKTNYGAEGQIVFSHTA